MTETPLFFNNGAQRLFGVLHMPDTAVTRAFVMCHPFAEEKLWSHRAHVSFARELSSRGIACLRFDMAGHGDSDGRFQDMTIETSLADIKAALDFLAGKMPPGCRIGLLGLRLGASLAALAAERFSPSGELILWDPVIDGEKYGQEVLLTNLATQMATHGKVVTDRAKLVAQMEAGDSVNIDGYEMSGTMFNEMCALKLVQEKKQFAGKCLVVQIDRGPKPPRPDLTAFAQSYSSGDLIQVVEQPFWKEIKEFYGRAERLTAATMNWLG